MALGQAYATVEELEAKLGRTDDGSFSMLLDAASRHVESFVSEGCNPGRQFNLEPPGSAATARRFRPLDCERLAVDDFHTLDDLAVETNGTPWDIASVDPRPWDGVVNGEPGWPFSDLFAVGRRWPYSRRALVTVTAHWGWAAVPTSIVQATLDVASIMSLGVGVGATPGVLSSQTVEGFSESYGIPSLDGNPEVPKALKKAAPYKRKCFGVA